MGLFGDLPSAKDSTVKGEDATDVTPGKARPDGSVGDVKQGAPGGATTSTTTGGRNNPGAGGGWSGAGSALRAPPRKPAAALMNPQMLKAQAAALRAQQAKLARQNENKGSTQQGGSTVKTPGKVPPGGVNGLSAPVVEMVSLGSLSADVKEEYVPSRPNSYEDVLRKRAKKKALEEAAAAREKQRLELERRRREIERARQEELGEGSQDRSVLKVSGEQAYLRRGRLSAGGTGEGWRAGDGDIGLGSGSGCGGASSSGGMESGGAGGGGMSLAQKMMMKMGWKEGQGLGKSDQGMITPLMAKKDGTHSGIIVNAPELISKRPEQQERRQTLLGAPAFVAAEAPQSTSSIAPPSLAPAKASVPVQDPATRVLLLRNMVGPGEVDEDLEDEVADECEKFGQVVRVIIFEMTEAGFPAQEAVRIFVEFTSTEGAMKCAADMNGRYFGGRTVAASYFEETKFASNDLGPQPGERPVRS